MNPDEDASQIADRIALAVLDVLYGRGGFDAWLDGCDTATKNEIVKAISNAAQAEIERKS